MIHTVFCWCDSVKSTSVTGSWRLCMLTGDFESVPVWNWHYLVRLSVSRVLFWVLFSFDVGNVETSVHLCINGVIICLPHVKKASPIRMFSGGLIIGLSAYRASDISILSCYKARANPLGWSTSISIKTKFPLICLISSKDLHTYPLVSIRSTSICMRSMAFSLLLFVP